MKTRQLYERNGFGHSRHSYSFNVGDSVPSRIRVKNGVFSTRSWPPWTASFERFLCILLPHGYPDSVSSDYAEFQVWDSLQGLSTYIRGMLCTQAILVGVGVGDSTANASSAAIQWLFLNGVGMLGGIVFVWGGSKEFGSDPKRWRLFADLTNDVGLTLSLSAPLFGVFFLPVAGLSSVCQAVCGVAAGATKAAISQHFAKNVGSASLTSDITAKEGVQETLVTLMGLVLGTLLSWRLDGSVIQTWIVFILLTCFHVYANYRAVCALSLSTLNQQRASILFTHWQNTDRILSPEEVSEREKVWGQWKDRFLLRMGIAMHEVVKCNNELDWLLDQINSEAESGPVVVDEAVVPYVIRISQKPKVAEILLGETATPLQKLEAYYRAHALFRCYQSPSEIEPSQETISADFRKLVEGLMARKWHLQENDLPDEGWRCIWPLPLAQSTSTFLHASKDKDQ